MNQRARVRNLEVSWNPSQPSLSESRGRDFFTGSPVENEHSTAMLRFDLDRGWFVGNPEVGIWCLVISELPVTRSESSKLREAAPHGVGATPWSSDQLRQLPCLFQAADSALIVT